MLSMQTDQHGHRNRPQEPGEQSIEANNSSLRRMEKRTPEPDSTSTLRRARVLPR